MHRKIKYSRPAPSKNAAHCMYCGGPTACGACGISYWEAGGLIDKGLCAKCAILPAEARQ